MENRVPGPGRRTSLLGRAGECAMLDGLVGDIRQGESRSLVLRGEAGIGKTALLEYVLEGASDLMVLRAAGVESEMELAYASLQQLCAPLLDGLARLPAPQRQALEIVFGLNVGAAPDRFLVGLGVLSLISEVAGERPLLCVVDDAQWLDQASALTLAFVARRLLAEPVGMVFAAREPGEQFQHLSSLEVRGLRNGDARAVLASAVRFRLDERVRDRIIAETRGNPLALLELPRGLTEMQLAGGFGLVEAQTLTGRIEESFVRRLEPLPEDTRLLLLVAAAEPVGDPLLLWRAAEHLGIEKAAADGARGAGLVEIGEHVTFRHPLVRSAVYRSAMPQERRLVHSALADVTDRQLDPDRRAWHRAQATAVPDEDVAAELERTAARAMSRGGLAAAAAFLERAARLTPNTRARVERTLAAAEVSLQAGLFEGARALLAAAEAGSLDEFQRARAELFRGQIALFSTFGADAPALLLKAAKSLEAFDAGLARDTYLDAWGASLFVGRLGSGGSGLLEVSHAARSAPRPEGPPRASDLLLDSLATLITEGRAAAGPLLWEATGTFSDDQFPWETGLRWGWMVVLPTYVLWDEESGHRICLQQVRTLRDTGALALLPLYLQTLIVLAVRCGDFASGAEALADAGAAYEATGADVAPWGAMMLAALRGREAEATALIESARKEAAALGQGIALQLAEWTYAILCNGLGRYQEAVTAAQQASNDDQDELFVGAWATAELVEAASRTSNTDLARVALERVLAATEFSSTDSALGIAARSRALVAEGAKAEGHYRAAIDHLSRSRLRSELARAHLLYGEWLRREGRRVDARQQLRTAHEMLLAMGMEAFAERARKELVATGEKLRKRMVETRDDLTAQERQIAQLACDGLSNPEIGARLFLSPRTVEWHLRKVFGKLGIRSRHQLADALAIADPEPTRV